MIISHLREYAKDKKMRFSPIIISHHMLMGLKEGQEKMSKSDPDSAIFMEDSITDVCIVFILLQINLSISFVFVLFILVLF